METLPTLGKRPHKLNDVQVSLLRMFSRDMTEQETAEVKRLLLTYYDEKLQAEIERVVVGKNYTQADYDAMLNGDNRTELKQQTTNQLDEGSH